MESGESLRPKEVIKAERQGLIDELTPLLQRQKELIAAYHQDIRAFAEEDMDEYKINKTRTDEIFDRLFTLRNELGSAILNDVSIATDRYEQTLNEAESKRHSRGEQVPETDPTSESEGR